MLKVMSTIVNVLESSSKPSQRGNGMGGRALIALGGNALCGADERGTYAEQRENARAMAASVRELIDAGWRVLIVHGNGPQVGALGVQQEEAATLVPPQPLSSLCAMTQGYLGSLIALALHERLGPAQDIVSVVTHVVVHRDDPAFTEPSKPIGPFFSEREAAELEAARHWTMSSDAGRGFRRLVPSPEPLAILEADAIRRLVDDGVVVIACGGGGVPVAMSSHGYVGVDAVIDKDLAAQRLASTLGVDALALVTAVPAVQLDHGTPRQRDLHALDVREAARYLADGQFGAGSMAPKIAAAIRFIGEGGSAVAITSPALLAATMAPPDGRPAGTLVTGARRSRAHS
jgi:carbamate kinase